MPRFNEPNVILDKRQSTKQSTYMKSRINRRQFIGTTAAAGAGLSLANVFGANDSTAASAASKPAVLGGEMAHRGGWPGWPVFGEPEEKALLETLRSGEWFRYYTHAVQVAGFEEAWAKRAGAKYCVATSSGTSATSGLIRRTTAKANSSPTG